MNDTYRFDITQNPTNQPPARCCNIVRYPPQTLRSVPTPHRHSLIAYNAIEEQCRYVDHIRPLPLASVSDPERGVVLYVWTRQGFSNSRLVERTVGCFNHYLIWLPSFDVASSFPPSTPHRFHFRVMSFRGWPMNSVFDLDSYRI